MHTSAVIDPLRFLFWGQLCLSRSLVTCYMFALFAAIFPPLRKQAGGCDGFEWRGEQHQSDEVRAGASEDSEETLPGVSEEKAKRTFANSWSAEVELSHPGQVWLQMRLFWTLSIHAIAGAMVGISENLGKDDEARERWSCHHLSYLLSVNFSQS